LSIVFSQLLNRKQFPRAADRILKSSWLNVVTELGMHVKRNALVLVFGAETESEILIQNPHSDGPNRMNGRFIMASELPAALSVSIQP
jgi:hypothetical protein